jgi:hypothetical protein
MFCFTQSFKGRFSCHHLQIFCFLQITGHAEGAPLMVVTKLNINLVEILDQKPPSGVFGKILL